MPLGILPTVSHHECRESRFPRVVSAWSANVCGYLKFPRDVNRSSMRQGKASCGWPVSNFSVFLESYGELGEIPSQAAPLHLLLFLESRLTPLNWIPLSYLCVNNKVLDLGTTFIKDRISRVLLDNFVPRFPSIRRHSLPHRRPPSRGKHVWSFSTISKSCSLSGLWPSTTLGG
jgi:hypothetical protein